MGAAWIGSPFSSIASRRGMVQRKRSSLSAVPSGSMSSSAKRSASPSRRRSCAQSSVRGTVTRSSPATWQRVRVVRHAVVVLHAERSAPTSQWLSRSRSGSSATRSTTSPSRRCSAGWSPTSEQRSWKSGSGRGGRRGGRPVDRALVVLTPRLGALVEAAGAVDLHGEPRSAGCPGGRRGPRARAAGSQPRPARRSRRSAGRASW